MQLSHRQMLLLNEYMYLDGSTLEDHTILETISKKFKDNNGNYIIDQKS